MTNTTTVTGNLCADPELRFTQAGKAVAGFTVAHTPRRLDKATGEWEDGTTLFLRCSVWGPKAEQIAEQQKGAPIMAAGKLVQNNWETKDGDKRSTIELLVENWAPIVRGESQPAKARPVIDEPPF